MSTDQKQFQIIDTVGKGAFGTVYRAEMTGPGGFRKSVALKVLNDDMAEKGDFAERLRDEARILGLLNHRAIVRVDGLRRWDGRWAVVMEFVEGVDLKRVLSAGAVPAGPALEMVEEVASALDSAYNATDGAGRPVRLLHRDIKPSNIHLTARGEVKVLDFGVARADFQARESETRSIFFGSIGYMGPERMDGIDSHAGDVYALGVVLCELLIGTTLGRSWSNPDRHEKHRVASLQKLWAACPDRDLYELVGRCLAYEPSHRPSARDLSRALRSIRARHREPWLRDWAEKTVPALEAAPEPSPEPVDGTMVADPAAVSDSRRGDTDVHETDSASHSAGVSKPRTAPAAAPEVEDRDRSSFYGEPAPRPFSPALVAGGAALVAMLLVLPVGIGIAWWTLQPPAEPVRPPARVIAPVGSDDAAIDVFVEEGDALDGTNAEAADLSDADSAGQKTPPPKQDGAKKPPPRKDPPRQEAASKPPPKKEAPPEAAASGRVVVTGDATQVRLVGGGSSYSAGSVPAGSYEVKAVFGSGPLKSAGRVTVPANGVVTLSCRAGLKRCVTR